MQFQHFPTWEGTTRMLALWTSSKLVGLMPPHRLVDVPMKQRAEAHENKKYKDLYQGSYVHKLCRSSCFQSA